MLEELQGSGVKFPYWGVPIVIFFFKKYSKLKTNVEKVNKIYNKKVNLQQIWGGN
jgi:arabinogalactan endo-1,4-beta-galactosidase